MEEGFEIPVTYKGKEQHFPARLLSFGYTYKIEVDVCGSLLHFERDEEGEWRALIDPTATQGDRQVDAELVRQIAHSIETLFK